MRKFLVAISFFCMLLCTISFAEEKTFVINSSKYVSAKYAEEMWDSKISYYDKSNIIVVNIDNDFYYMQVGNEYYLKNIFINPFFINSDKLSIVNGEKLKNYPLTVNSELYIPIDFFYNLLYQSNEYDVIVVGGDPEGVAAAISAARNGAKTLIISSEEGWGGLFTYGMLNTLDMNYSKDGELLTKGIFEEFYDKIGRTESFDVGKVKKIFNDMLASECNIDFRTNYGFKEAILNENTIVGIKAIGDGEEKIFYGKRIIDATQDGDVCANAGVPYSFGMEDIYQNERMAATLVFKVAGVDWKELGSDINRYRNETGDIGCGINESTAWGFGKWCYDKYNSHYYYMKLRGPNIGLQEDGTVLINALQIFEVDIKDEKSIENAKKYGAVEAGYIVEYFKTILNSFKDAKLVGVADELYIRETRHINGEYSLKASDLFENANFEDKIAMGSYSLDIQSTGLGNNGYVIFVPDQYSIPLRCIVPLKIDNLFIVGKAASYSSVAAGSARVVPIGMVEGESAGAISVYSIIANVAPRQIIGNFELTDEMNSILKSQGVYLPDEMPKNIGTEIKDYDKLKELLNLGVLVGGYSNDFGLEKEANLANASYGLTRITTRMGLKLPEGTSQKISNFASTEKATASMMGRLILTFFGKHDEKMTDKEVINQINLGGYFKEVSVVTPDDVFTLRDVYLVLLDAIKIYSNTNV